MAIYKMRISKKKKKLIKEKILCCKDVNIKLKGSIKIKIKKRKKKITQNQS